MFVKSNIILNADTYKESKSRIIDNFNVNSNKKRKKTYYLKINSFYENNSIIENNINYNELTYGEAI